LLLFFLFLLFSSSTSPSTMHLFQFFLLFCSSANFSSYFSLNFEFLYIFYAFQLIILQFFPTPLLLVFAMELKTTLFVILSFY
jgi:hypothetical protein